MAASVLGADSHNVATQATDAREGKSRGQVIQLIFKSQEPACKSGSRRSEQLQRRQSNAGGGTRSGEPADGCQLSAGASAVGLQVEMTEGRGATQSVTFTVACRTCRDSLVSLSDPCRCYLACACISLCYADENLGPRGPRLPLLGSLIAGDSCCRKQLTTQLHRSGETLIRHGRPSLMSGRYIFRGEAKFIRSPDRPAQPMAASARSRQRTSRREGKGSWRYTHRRRSPRILICRLSFGLVDC